MKVGLHRKDPDFEEWAVKLNGEYLCHDTIVSADAITGTVVRLVCDGDGVATEEQKTTVGMVRFVQRSEAVRAKEPPSRGRVVSGIVAEVAPHAEEPAPEPVEETPAPVSDEPPMPTAKPLGRVTIRKA